MKIPLSKPIQAHGQEVHEIDLREPDGGDVMECGYPLTIGDGEARPNADIVGKLIVRLGGIPLSSVKQLSARDFQACLGGVLSFFGE